MARLQLALDTGGTFADVVMVDGESGWRAGRSIGAPISTTKNCRRLPNE